MRRTLLALLVRGEPLIAASEGHGAVSSLRYHLNAGEPPICYRPFRREHVQNPPSKEDPDVSVPEPGATLRVMPGGLSASLRLHTEGVLLSGLGQGVAAGQVQYRLSISVEASHLDP
ncbi:hypothetical protein B0T18DRAFT_395093 [Schizothecium vesticola]|uniref:Uncharacterized protein n=1 Tax=Schizothecium vesticola TaxID=314040 RepID=A0AA40BR74_9PEZI|nr:hypothetical protein B0T18DRAFT_395093 [Schizothecium vesticola]